MTKRIETSKRLELANVARQQYIDQELAKIKMFQFRKAATIICAKVGMSKPFISRPFTTLMHTTVARMCAYDKAITSHIYNHHPYLLLDLDNLDDYENSIGMKHHFDTERERHHQEYVNKN